MTDSDLLKAYAAKGSEEALGDLVQRYTPMVYSTCLRRLGSSAEAEDATQATFIALSQKARSIRRPSALGAWLHRMAEWSAGSILREAARRRRREAEVAKMKRDASDEPGPKWSEVRPVLDLAIESLPARYREVVISRYLVGKSEAQVAREMGLGRSTVSMRLSRALEKLRAKLTRKGVTVGGASLAAVLVSNAVEAAPVQLASTVAAVCTGKAAASGTVAVVAEGAMRALMIAKLKVAAAVVAVTLAAGAGTGIVVARAAEQAPPRPAGGPVELTVTLENGGAYASATDDAGEGALKPHVNMKAGASVGRKLRFGDLGDWIRGERIEILEAKLQLFYYDEYWTKLTYRVAASRSLDGSVTVIADEPEGTVDIRGDKWPPKEKTPRPSWVEIPLKPETVKAWLEGEKKNTGLVLHCPTVVKDGGEAVAMKLVNTGGGGLGPYFRSCGGMQDRPRLVVRYRVNGNAPPSSPTLSGIPEMWKVYSEARLALEPSVDPNGDEFSYEIESAFGPKASELKWRKASASVEGGTVKWSFGADWKTLAGAGDGGLWLRIRAIDGNGGASRWEAAGPYDSADRPWTVWSTHGNRKIWPDIKPVSAHGSSVKIMCARNEWEPFQVVVMSHGGLSDVKIEAGKFTDGRGNEISALTGYRQHYMPIADTANRKYGHIGMVPDALVPLVHPVTGKPTGGKYGGASFDVPTGKLEAFWFDIYVGRDKPAGTYRGSVKVTAEGLKAVELPVELEVFDFELPAVKRLKGFFQIGESSVAFSHRWGKKPLEEKRKLCHMYEEMLHDHYISNWSPITGFNYGLNGVKVSEAGGKIAVDWTAFDRLVGPYMDGTAFRDKVPAQCLYVPYYLPVLKADRSARAARINKFNYRNVQYDLFAQWIREVQRHMEEKGWLDRAYVFYFDEPFLQKWKYDAFIQTAKIIRKEAPKLRIMITDGYKGEEAYKKLAHIKEPITQYVDVWDPVTFQVRANTVEFYRKRRKEGKFDIWCQTLGNANRNVPLPNLFPEYDMPFHRTWGAMSWNFGFQGMEWWATVIWWNSKQRKRLDPWTNPVAFPPFNKPLNCDGRLFYNGMPEAIGGEDIPISCLRMKALREAIEDYEYFFMLDKLGHTEAEFDINSLHTIIAGKSRQMRSAMTLGGVKPGKPAWQWWEGDPDAMMSVREEVARLIVQKKQ